MTEDDRVGRTPCTTVVHELRRMPRRKQSCRHCTGTGPEPGQHGQTQDPPYTQRP